MAKRRQVLHTVSHGPYIPKRPYGLMKRAIRGMLPDYRVGRGREAWKRIKCYVGIPEEFKNEKMVKMEGKIPFKIMTIKELGKSA